MTHFTITIQEVIKQEFTVQASSIEEALDIARRNYDEAIFVVENPTLLDTKISATAMTQQEVEEFISANIS